ncbi:MAG: agmatinase [Alphaproteobacteria bacterium]|nr:agmatinase [Alphaproteobacteria bacterium]
MKLRYLPSEKGFLGLEGEDVAAAAAAIIPFGLEASVSYGGGTAKGPKAIIEASPQLEFFDEELWCEPYRKFGIATLKSFPIKKKIVAALKQIEEVVGRVLEDGKFPLVLGGEHSLTAGAIRPFVKRHKKLTLLHFDAHADLRDGYEGEKYSHAAAMRRCLDFPNVNLVSVGIRNISAEEVVFLDDNKNRIKIFWGKDREKWKISDIVKAVGKGPFYITFDVDGFDSSLMPATGTPEPGGFFWKEAIDIIRAVCKSGQLVGADVVELAPQKGLHACDFLAAKLCYKILTAKYCQ